MTLHCVTFQAESPIHVGAGAPFGFVARTRYYIPARTLWGAFTRTLTECVDGKHRGDYAWWGDWTAEHLKTSAAFVTYDGSRTPLWPEYRTASSNNGGGGLFYGDLTRDEFERAFISSYASQSQDPDSLASQDDSLHEIEYIRPRFRLADDDKLRETWLCFIVDSDKLGCDGNLTIADGRVDLKQLAGSMRIGGEETYGFARVSLAGIASAPTDITQIYHRPGREEKRILLQHVQSAGTGIDFVGEVERYLARAWDNSKTDGRGAGRMVVDFGLCFQPGTVIDHLEAASFSDGTPGEPPLFLLEQ